MEIERLKNSLKKKNKQEIINILSYKYFNDFINIKNNYNKSFSNTLFIDISNFKKKFKLFLIGIFDTLDLKVYLIHKSLKHKKKDFLNILFKLDHTNALKIKKRYFEIYGKNLENEFKNDDTFIYIMHLLSNYFFPNTKKKDLKRIVEQLIKISEGNDADLNFISYCFQQPNDILSKIIKLYEKKKGEKILNFIKKNFKLNIQEILENRISFMNDSDLDILADLQNAIKNKDSWMLTKIIILNKNNWFDIKRKYIKMYGEIDFDILNKDTLNLYKNIIEFNYYDITMNSIFRCLKFYSIPLMYILNIDKISLKKYIKSYTKKESIDYSEWCDRIEKDLNILDDFIYSIIKGKIDSFEFSFKVTKSIAFIIKVILLYYKNITNFPSLLEEQIKEESITDHKKILEKISKTWTFQNFNEFYLFFPYEAKNQIYILRYYIIELTFLCCKKDKVLLENDIYHSLKKDNEHSAIFSNVGLPFKICDPTTLMKFHKSIISCQNFEILFGEKQEEILDPGWSITKTSKFYVTYKNRSINYKN